MSCVYEWSEHVPCAFTLSSIMFDTVVKSCIRTQAHTSGFSFLVVSLKTTTSSRTSCASKTLRVALESRTISGYHSICRHCSTFQPCPSFKDVSMTYLFLRLYMISKQLKGLAFSFSQIQFLSCAHFTVYRHV